MKLLVRYGKQGRMTFASHRDFARVFERALRRAAVPMAFSSGFTPHPRISYINPAPTGVASEAEYLIIALSQLQDPANVRIRLAAAIPQGFPILDVTDQVDAVAFEASEWEIRLPSADPVPLSEAVAHFLAAREAMVSRETKNGLRSFDARKPVEALALPEPTRLLLVIRHTEPLVRPDDVLGALGLPPDPALAASIKRLRQSTAADLLDRGASSESP